MPTRGRRLLERPRRQVGASAHLHVPRIRGVVTDIAEHTATAGRRQRLHAV